MMNLLPGFILIPIGIIFTIIIFRYAFKGKATSNQITSSIDGSKFESERSRDEYDYLYKKLNCLFDDDYKSKQRKGKKILGLNILFVDKLVNKGFIDTKTLINSKNDFKLLADLFDYEEDFK